MKHIPTLQLLALTSIGALFAAPAFAEDAYYYGGLSVGSTRGQLHPNDLTAKQLPPGTTVNGETSIDDRETNFKLFGGYQLNRYLGFEAGYFTLGKFPIQASTTTAGAAGTLNGRQNFKGLNFDVVGTLPFTEKFSGLGRIGAQFIRNRSLYTGSNFTPNDPAPNSRSTNYKVGVGLQYEISRSMLLRTELERYRVEESPGNLGIVNSLSVGLVIPFGRAPQTVRSSGLAPYVSPAPARAPAPVMAQAAPPAASPMVVVLAPATPAPAVVMLVPERRRVSYSAESMFGFDKSAVQPAGMAALDTFTVELKGTQFDFITVEGHTDRLGTAEYNQKLSLERAEAVKAYLVSPGGVDAAKIRTVGMSESVPVTKPDDCKGTEATSQLTACLQPDRRVEIEVTGTKR
jgi:OmpA-OmpF porin, OOP family